jgi:hypothetical protein
MKLSSSLVYVSHGLLLQDLPDSYALDGLTKLQADISLHGGLEELNRLVASLGMHSLPVLLKLETVSPTHGYLRMLCYDWGSPTCAFCRVGC